MNGVNIILWGKNDQYLEKFQEEVLDDICVDNNIEMQVTRYVYKELDDIKTMHNFSRRVDMHILLCNIANEGKLMEEDYRWNRILKLLCDNSIKTFFIMRSVLSLDDDGENYSMLKYSKSFIQPGLSLIVITCLIVPKNHKRECIENVMLTITNLHDQSPSESQSEEVNYNNPPSTNRGWLSRIANWIVCSKYF